MIPIKNRKIVPVCLFVFFSNFIMFALKLYVGLSSNIISIYSDGINNLFDSLSGLLTTFCFIYAMKSGTVGGKAITEKTEQFLSVVLSAAVVMSGVIFAYNSLERLVYPTPVWFTMSFLWTLMGTAACKLGMYFYLKRKHENTSSQSLRVMSLDCRMDFFINLITIGTLIVSKYEFYAFDAFCGIGISVLIIISGMKVLLSSARALMNLPEKIAREEIEGILEEFGVSSENSEILFLFTSKKQVLVKSTQEIPNEKIQQIKMQVSQKTGIELYILK